MGKERFPVILMTVPVHKEMEEIINNYERPAAAMFENRFEHELKYVLGWFK